MLFLDTQILYVTELKDCRPQMHSQEKQPNGYMERKTGQTDGIVQGADSIFRGTTITTG